MLIEEFWYPRCHISPVVFDAGDQHFISPDRADRLPCVGILMLYGSWRLHSSGKESTEADLGWHTPLPDGTWPRSFWNDYTAEDYCEAGPNGVKWLCVEGNAHVTFERVAGSFILQPNIDFIVADGSFTIGDQQSESINYWQHESADPVEVAGNGSVLLVA